MSKTAANHYEKEIQESDPLTIRDECEGGVDPYAPRSYNERMISRPSSLPMLMKVLWGSALVLGIAGCSTRGSFSKNPQEPTYAQNSDAEGNRNPVILEEEYEAKARGDKTFDIPVVRNEKVEEWIRYFQGRGRKYFVIYLERSGRFVPFMRKILRDHDLPEDLVNLAMIESGFSVRAYSRARAAGLWQFIKSTGRLYGLRVNYWLDERRDPEKATIAAARHLKDLYDQFQSWKLAAAAYNAGGRKVSRAIEKYKTEDFWELTKGRYLKKETRNYVPKMIAAALMAKDPEKFGFTDIEYEEPLEYDKVVLEEPVNLEVLAKKADMDLRDLMDLNPELNHPVTPPGSQNYELRVPVGSSDKILVAYNSLEANDRFQYASHRVRKGDTFAKLAKIYNVPSREILKFNGLKSEQRLGVGSTVLVPVVDAKNLESLESRVRVIEPERGSRRRLSREIAKRSVIDYSRNSAKGEMVAEAPSRGSSPATALDLDEQAPAGTHIVRRGETLSSIAQKYSVKIADLKTENNLRRSAIRPGQRLRLPSSKKVHVVRRGESLAVIAERYGTTITNIKSTNGLRRDQVVPGRRLLIPSSDG